MSVTQFTAVTLHFKSAAAQEYSIMPKKQEVNMAKVTGTSCSDHETARKLVLRRDFSRGKLFLR